MTLSLTQQQWRALHEAKDTGPVSVVDPDTATAYVLIPADTYHKVQALLSDDGEPNADEFLPLAAEAFADDLNAPGMEVYDHQT